MKISSVSNARTNSYYSINNSKNNRDKAPSFRGFSAAADCMARFWQFVDNGGRALQFTVEDMTGTNIPRSLKGLLAGIKYTGHVNWPAFFQEAIREFLTGPTMCITPVVVLNAATRMSGKTANTHVENIRNLSYLMNSVKNGQNAGDFKNDFFSVAAEDMLKCTTGNNNIKQADIDSMYSGMLNYSTKKTKKEAAKALSELQDKFESIVKAYKSDYKNSNFTQARYSISDTVQGSTGFKNYISYINSYAADYIKKFKDSGTELINIDKDTIKYFKTDWMLKRVITIISMIGITGCFMSIIPKLYTKASGRINPNASAIYNEAGKTNAENKSKEAK